MSVREIVLTCQEYLSEFRKNGIDSEQLVKLQEYVFEAAMESTFGAQVWDEINKEEE